MSLANQQFLGSGLLSPLKRLGAGDFISSTGVTLVRAAIVQILGTQRGELAWRPSFGVTTVKHKNKPNTEALAAILADNIQSSLKQFEPRISTVQATVTNNGNQLIAQITWSVIDKNSANNQVIVGPDTFSVVM